MAYATPAQLRARFKKAGVDEFALRLDADLAQALDAASAEIDRYRPAGTLSAAATASLADICLTLARLLAHQDDALGPEHPVVREAQAARSWLGLLARGVAQLPSESSDPVSSYAAPVRSMVFGDDFTEQYAP